MGSLIGKKAPSYTLNAIHPNGDLKPVTLIENMENSEWTVLVFYPNDFSKVCPTELTAISDRLNEFEELHCRVVAASVDDIETHRKWIETPRYHNGLGYLKFPLASDENGQVIKQYNVFDEEHQTAQRALFIIDPSGTVLYVTVMARHIGRDVEEVLRVIQALQTGGLCPANWKPGNTVL